MESVDNDAAEISLKDRISAQILFFKKSILGRLGITSKEASQFDSFKQIDPDLPPDARQLLLKTKITANLDSKGILATEAENLKFYEERFGLKSGYAAPEDYRHCPGGATFVDRNTRKTKIYLNPFLDAFKPDYQLLTVIEEAIHYYQLMHSGRTEVNNQDEIEAKDKILKIADFLELSEERREYEEQTRKGYKRDF